MHRNIKDLCILFLYPATLWNSFMSFSNLATSCEELTHWRRLWCWEGLGAGGEGDDRGDGWMASLTRWTWVWVNSGSWWWTGRPGVLRFMGSQRLGHDWATELNWTWELLYVVSCHLQIVTVLLLPFQLGVFKNFFLVYLLWLGLPMLCWIKVLNVGVLVLFLILEEMLSAFHCWVWCELCACHGCMLSQSVVSDSMQPMDCSPPGSSTYGISQASILEWVSISSSKGSSWSRNRIHVSCTGKQILYHWAIWEASWACHTWLLSCWGIPTLLRVYFYLKICWLRQHYFCIYWEIICFLFFRSLMWYTALIDLWILNRPWIPGKNPPWSWFMIL